MGDGPGKHINFEALRVMLTTINTHGNFGEDLQRSPNHRIPRPSDLMFYQHFAFIMVIRGYTLFSGTQPV